MKKTIYIIRSTEYPMIANVVQWWLLTGVIVVGAHTYILHTHIYIYQTSLNIDTKN